MSARPRFEYADDHAQCEAVSRFMTPVLDPIGERESRLPIARQVEKSFAFAYELAHPTTKVLSFKIYGAGSVPIESTAAQFRKLADQWRKETALLSSVEDAAMHPAYQQIIGMGPSVLPFIFSELATRGGQWFWALLAITRQDPVAPENRGKIKLMKNDWLEWARKNGYAVSR